MFASLCNMQFVCTVNFHSKSCEQLSKQVLKSKFKSKS